MEEAVHLRKPADQEPSVGSDGVTAQRHGARFANVLTQERQGRLAGFGQGGGGRLYGSQ